jgi:hypothetical protein
MPKQNLQYEEHTFSKRFTQIPAHFQLSLEQKQKQFDRMSEI